ncbi:hypothetical protein, conserved [Eimeria maxima]|uniref:Uncharacterized protein n=1 Tax=Eimeria maxima TaxID=5804 RepID=U6MFQ7_EIMMA|nr:hypothetical protein, conserved [Eimeria maxima]CDJ61294.1 hypothetical protein, conserved [Eimeria maxima]
MRWPSAGSFETVWGLRLNTRAFLLFLLLLQQGRLTNFVEGVGISVSPVPVGGSDRDTQNAVFAHLGGEAPMRDGLHFHNYGNEDEYYLNSLWPSRGRRWFRYGNTAAAAAGVIAALLAVVFMLLSCGTSISRKAVATQIWRDRRRLASRMDGGPCENTSVAEQNAAEAEDIEGEEVSSMAPKSTSVDLPSPPSSPRGVVNEGAGEGIAEAGVVNKASHPSVEASVSPANATGKARDPEAESEAAEQAAGEGGESGAGHEGSPIPVLWPAGIETTVKNVPFLGYYLIRLRELADHCRHFFKHLPPLYARLIGLQLLRYAVVEIAAVTPVCTFEEEGRREGAIRAFQRFSSNLRERFHTNPDVASSIDRLRHLLNVLLERNAFPQVAIVHRSFVSRHCIPPAAAALRYVATGINDLLQSLGNQPQTLTAVIAAEQDAVIFSVLDERVQQALSEEGSALALQHLQRSCRQGEVFSFREVNLSRAKYRPGCGPFKTERVENAAKKAAARVAAATGKDRLTLQAKGAAVEIPTASTNSEGINAVDGEAMEDDHRISRRLATTRSEQQQSEQEMAPAVSAAEGSEAPPKAASPEPPQDGTSEAAKQPNSAATEEPDAAEKKKRSLLGSPRFAFLFPRFPPSYFLSTLAPGVSPRPPHFPLFPYAPTRNFLFLQHPHQVGRQQHPVLPWGPLPQPQQGAWPWGPFLQQQQQMGFWVGVPRQQQRAAPLEVPLQPEQQHPRTWGSSPEEQWQLGIPWGPFHQQQQQHQEEPWGPPFQQQQGNIWGPPSQQQQRGELWRPWLQPQTMEPWLPADGFMGGQPDPVDAFLAPLDSGSRASALMTPESIPDEHDWLQRSNSGTDGDSAEESDSLEDPDHSAPAIAQAEKEDRSVKPKQHKRQKDPPSATGLFQGSDFTSPTAPPQGTEDYLSMQRQQEQLLSASAGVWGLRDIAGTSRDAILQGAPNWRSLASQRDTSGADSSHASSRGSEHGVDYAGAVRSGLKRKRETSPEDDYGK